MKLCPLVFTLGAVCLAALPLSTSAQETFNPSPSRVESPADDPATVLQRLSASSDGKTPTVKKFDPAWVQSLGQRGEPHVYTKDNSNNFAYIGMCVGGIGAGELYLSGDGKLWLWDIFNTFCWDGFGIEQGHSYVAPHTPGKPDNFVNVLDQGFVLQTTSDGKTDTRTIDKDGFSDVKFRGQYPIGYVDYSDPACPVKVGLEAFSPFTPGDVDDSSYPATILNYTLTNASDKPVDCVIGGWVENGDCWKTRHDTPVQLENHVVSMPGYTAVNCSASQVMTGVKPPQVFEDFESGTYDGWTVTGTAFGTGPVKVGSVPRSISTPPDCQGQYYIDTYIHDSNDPQGTLTSKPFVIARPYIRFLVGGGGLGQKQSVNLLVDGKVVRDAAGRATRRLRPFFWDVHDLMGKTAQIQVSDASSGGWAFIQADDFVFADTARDLTTAPDSGTMTLALLGDPSGTEGLADANPSLGVDGKILKTSDTILTAPATASVQSGVSDTHPTVHGARADQATAGLKTDLIDDHNPRLVGGLRHKLTLQPGQKVTLHYILSWCFPNPTGMPTEPSSCRAYAERFKSSQEVVDKIGNDFDRLTGTTRLWHDTWYDSTLPWWFLDRTFLNVSTLASSTCFLLDDDLFYGNEGGYSCPGTCTHVYSYQQAMGFLFPDLEKSLQEKVELNDTGGIGTRGGGGGGAVDGQAGVILRCYLVDRMSPDDSYLTKNYPDIKKSMNFLIDHHDADHDGILEGAQGNTLDSAWYGKVAWLSLYYQAALRATAEMADEMHDADYAKELRGIANTGRTYIEQKLFDGDYFVEDVDDPKHQDSPGSYTGCEIDQLMGQAWAYHDGLGQIIDPAQAETALNSIWKYNYTTDVGPYLQAFPKPKARAFALPGEGGVLMCTFPKGVIENALTKGYGAYFNECWAGSEHLLASLMMWDGLADKALAVERTIDDRYSALKRNPWDEVECGSHYARSMSSYGVFTAACGFEYDGPHGSLAFAPRLTPENFKAAFTAAEGWGSFSQKYEGTAFSAEIDLGYGKLSLETLALVPPAGHQGGDSTVTVDGKAVAVTSQFIGGRLIVHFTPEIVLSAGQKLALESR